MIKLHYGEGIDLKKDIVEIELLNQEELRKFIQEIRKKDKKDTVYVFTSNIHCFEDDGDNEYSLEIFIESDLLTLLQQISAFDYYNSIVYLQEYGSFEDAYKVALDMREVNPLCYDNNKN